MPENDSNTLNKPFFAELLHIIGLAETKQGGKKLIGRKKEGERNPGSLLENAVAELDAYMNRLENPNQFGETEQERLFNVGLDLVLTWVNRLLFLRLLEAQMITWHRGDRSFSFLNSAKIRNFHDLSRLFFQVLARKTDERNEDVRREFENVPYLNSSLFEPADLEHETLFISGLDSGKRLPLFCSTVLKDGKGKRLTGELGTLEYLFRFLDAYDFSGEGAEEIQEESKSLINASVLGLIFEKINGYKDGSFFTPGFITMYMCRETIRRAVVQKFNEQKGWECKNFDDLYNKISDMKEANEIVNSLKICDPAVGSGHFPVSALNEIIAVKSDLRILSDREGRRMKEYHAEVVNDELIVTDENGEIFEYHPGNPESRRVQETLFHEKQTIIENCLFGVDINPNSVKICCLRLWIELLKHAYYKNENELETLPNIDINIRCGNSLISRFSLDADLKQTLRKSKWNMDSYKIAVRTYRKAAGEKEKRELKRLIADIKKDFRAELGSNHPKLKRLSRLGGELYDLMNQQRLFEESAKEKKAREQKQKKLEKEISVLRAEIEEIQSSRIYDNAFEWRFEFPEVLNDEGEFTGFDVVIGNPPYIKEYEEKQIFDGLRERDVYQGKMDIWYLFGSHGIDIIKPKGLLAFIAQNNWITSSGASKFRNKIINDVQIIELVDFGSYMVFEATSIQTIIMLFQKDRTLNEYEFYLKRLTSKNVSLNDVIDLLSNNQNSKAEYIKPKIKRYNFIDKTLTFSNQLFESILNKILTNSNNTFFTEKEIAQGIVFPQDFINKASKEKLNNKFEVGSGIFGLSQLEKEKMNLKSNELKLIKPYFTTEQFHKYWASEQNNLWLIYTDSKFKNPAEIESYPNIKKHLDKFKTVITSDNKPYGLHRARDNNFFKGEKIIVQRKCSEKPVFIYTDFETYVSATFYIIKTDRLSHKFLTGLLNSKVIEFWLRNRGKMQGNNYQIDKEPLLKIPIINANELLQNKVSKIVTKIITIKKQDPQADTTALEKEIDRLVYELYGLTEEEIAIVEQGR